MDYQMQPGQGPEKSKKGLIIALIAGGVFMFGSVACCLGLFGFGFFAAMNVEKTYYAECQQVVDGDHCAACCRARGHSGNAYGSIINDDGQLCGCI